MQLTHAVDFTFSLALSQAAAVDFVRDAQTSLSRASFIENLETHADSVTKQQVVTASLPVNAALFGQQVLHFKSRVVPTIKGAKLEPLPLETDQIGWAEVTGEATTKPLPQGSEVTYHFDITIHLLLPKAEKWGGKALTRMIEFTAQHVLETITAGFPKAVQEAAKELEKAYSKL
jgi:Protein of unknown function (DUF3809)